MHPNDILDDMDEKWQSRMRKVRRFANRVDPEIYRDIHGWLAKFTNGFGYDLCCGDFVVPGAEGQNGEWFLGAMMGKTAVKVEDMPHVENEECDFIVSNYLEGVSNTLSTLLEWHRVLKSGGVLALVCANADHSNYVDRKGPLVNNHRVNCFTSNTIRCYLERAGFSRVEVEEFKHMLRIKCVKE